MSQLTKDRFLVEWENEIAPAIKGGKRVLLVAHGNTIRGLCQHLDEISDEDITGLDIPTGEPCRKVSSVAQSRDPVLAQSRSLTV